MTSLQRENIIRNGQSFKAGLSADSLRVQTFHLKLHLPVRKTIFSQHYSRFSYSFQDCELNYEMRLLASSCMFFHFKQFFSQWMNFHEILYLENFRKSLQEIQFFQTGMRVLYMKNFVHLFYVSMKPFFIMCKFYTS